MRDILEEITPIATEDLFIVLNHPNADFDYPVHYHHAFEINLVMNTDGERVVGDCEEPFESYDLVMVGPNLPHAWKGNRVEGNHVVTIQFSDELLDFPILSKRLFEPVRHLLIEAQQGLEFTSSRAKDAVVEKIVRLTTLQGFQTALEFLGVLHDLSQAPRRHLVSTTYNADEIVFNTKSRRVRTVCQYVESHFSQPLRLEDMAELVSMSPSAFSHFFKKRTRTPFIVYLNNLRVAKASEMLADTAMSVGEICYACGFNNSSNFIRIFKKIRGTTPSAYRTYIRTMLIKY